MRSWPGRQDLHFIAKSFSCPPPPNPLPPGEGELWGNIEVAGLEEAAGIGSIRGELSKGGGQGTAWMGRMTEKD
jgi:hypothetical protein